MLNTVRKTKIVATVGPACEDEAVLRRLIRAGADVLRINASHTTPASLRAWIERIRGVTEPNGKFVAILVDLQGPRVRIGAVEGGEALLTRGDDVIIEVGEKPATAVVLRTPSREFPKLVKPGDTVLLDNGMIELQVKRVRGKRVACRVLRGGRLKSNKGINLPQAQLALPALTRKDKADLEVAAECGVEYVALSFVRSASDVKALQQWIKRRKKPIRIVAKVEKPGAVQHVEEILRISDGLMVARGDLGIEIGVEKIPALQKALIDEASEQQVPVITATEMLESMIEKPRPTRAEVSDIANAVFDGTDAVMLSGETAAGKHPVQAVRTMAQIALEAEKHMESFSCPHGLETEGDGPVHAITHAALNAARELNAKAIIVFTRSGRTAKLVSKLKPACPVIALAPSRELARPMALYRGVIPLAVEQCCSTDEMIRSADAAILARKLLRPKDPVIVVSGRWAMPAARYMTKVHQIGAA